MRDFKFEQEAADGAVNGGALNVEMQESVGLDSLQNRARFLRASASSAGFVGRG